MTISNIIRLLHPAKSPPVPQGGHVITDFQQRDEFLQSIGIHILQFKDDDRLILETYRND